MRVRLRTLAGLLLLAFGDPTRGASVALAATVDDLPEGVDWRVSGIAFSGNEAITTGDLEDAMLTKERAWWAPWRDRPPFDRVTFVGDLERILRVYESRGYYGAEVSYDLAPVPDEEDELELALVVNEGLPVEVADVVVEIEPGEDAETDEERALREKVPLSPGEPFVESEYLKGDQTISTFFLDTGHAHVRTTREARVDRELRTAHVRYAAVPGPVATFGETEIVGTEEVDPEIARREIEYQPGEQFSVAKVDKSQAKIVGLELFRGVRFTPELDGPDPTVVPMRLELEEKPPREIRIGFGYGTDEGPRGQIQWRHRNWLGGGRQLFLSLQGSQITSDAEVTLIQPHLFDSPATRGIASFRILRDDEETYDQLALQLIPRIEHRFTPTLLGFVAYRIEGDRVSDVDQATSDAIGGFKDRGILSAPGIGLLWDTTDNPLDPHLGHVVSLQIAQAGVIWGGDFEYWRFLAEGKKYVEIPWETVLALRLAVGLADSIGAEENLPIFERFYAGGEKSVRGYARHRLGPLSTTNRPLGGLSLVEGSVELRRAIWGPIGGAVFVDFGQVSLDAFDPPVSDLKFATGFGLSYATPIGPLRLDIGFPFDPPPGDMSWQLHFSIGQFF